MQPSPEHSLSPRSHKSGTPGSDSSALYSYSLPALALGWPRPRGGSPGGRPSASMASEAALSERPPTWRDSERMCTRLRPVACMRQTAMSSVAGVADQGQPRAEVLTLVRVSRLWMCGCGSWQHLHPVDGGMR